MQENVLGANVIRRRRAGVTGEQAHRINLGANH